MILGCVQVVLVLFFFQSSCLKLPVRQIQPDTVCINICLHACDRQWEHSLQLFAYLERHLKPSVVSYGALFTSLGCAHKWFQVLALLQTMPMQNPSNMNILFNTTVGAFESSHRWDLALDLCNSLATNGFEIKLDAVGWGSVIAACSKGSQWETGLILLRRSQDLRVCSTLQTYNWLLKGMKCEGNWRVGLALLQDATDSRIQLNHVSFSNLLQLWRKQGLWHKALIVLEQVRLSNLPLDAEALTSMAVAMQRNHRLEESKCVLLSIKKKLLSQLRDCPDPTSTTELHGTTMLFDAWAGASLPDAFGAFLSRRLGAPLTAAVLQRRSACVNTNLLQNVHDFSTLHARLVAESAATASTVRQKCMGARAKSLCSFQFLIFFTV